MKVLFETILKEDIENGKVHPDSTRSNEIAKIFKDELGVEIAVIYDNEKKGELERKFSAFPRDFTNEAIGVITELITELRGSSPEKIHVLLENRRGNKCNEFGDYITCTVRYS